MTAAQRYDTALIGHMPGGEKFHLSNGKWVRPDGGPVDYYRFFRGEKADWTHVPPKRLWLRTRFQLKRDADTAARIASTGWAKAEGFGPAREDVRTLCEQAGVEYPESKFGIYPEMLRTEAPEWWGRQLKKADRRAFELEEIRAGRVNRYCSDGILNARRSHKKEMAALLDRLVAVCENDEGEQQEVELAKLVEKSNANPVKRRQELMTRIRGFEEYAKRKGHLPFFYTLTCPSKFHRNSGERWNGASPRDAQAYLCDTWAKCRAALDRAGVRVYGFRVAEPHKDGCPHWHAVFWFESYDDKRTGNRIIREYFLEEDGNEPGAKRNRVKIVDIADVGGSATGYVAKYVCKNVDGVYQDAEGTDVSFDAHDRDGRKVRDENGKKLDSGEAAQRVDAWASCWGIRQFQQIGGPRVGVWRELRRLEPFEGRAADTIAGRVLEPMREAADRGQWDLFTELAASQSAAGKPVRLWTDTSTELVIRKAATKKEGAAAISDDELKSCLNKWQEPAVRRVRGLVVDGFIKVKTRFLQWVLMMKAAADTQIVRAMIQQDRQEELAGYWDKFQQQGLSRSERKGVERLAVLLGFQGVAQPPPLESCQ